MNDTLTKMKQMRLLGMAKAFLLTQQSEKNEMFTPDEMVSHLIDSEWDERYNRKLERTIHSAHFRYKASIEQLSFDNDRVNKNHILRLADCEFIKQNENIIITGSTGIGKSFLASALGYQACSLGYRVIYHNNVKLFGGMKIAKADGSYLKELAKIERQHLLIIDDFGMQPLDAQSRAALMEIIEDRHGKSSTIITSQIPVSKWHEIIGDQTMADAILDRIVHNAHRIEMNGESLRKKKNINFEENIDLRNIKN
jgi:DNA replication protein DnaC